MKHHPIPQQISSYEFRLVGSMTLKQFIKLASGLIIAFIFYQSRLIFFIKWPLVIGFASFGAALAFLPLNEQPLERWILTFFQSIYSPTIYIWQKQPKTIDFDEQEFQQPKRKDDTPLDTKDKEIKLEEFIASIDDKKEEEKVTQPMPKIVTQKKVDKKKPLKTREETKEKTQKEEVQKPAKTKPDEQPQAKTETEKDDSEFILELGRKKREATAEAEFGEIPRPEPPKTPNKVVGMVFDYDGKIIENAIIEIQDQKGVAVRALRTNRLGQFETATPLSNGEYLVMVEKENHKFDILKIEAKGKILEPLIIRAKQNQES